MMPSGCRRSAAGVARALGPRLALGLALLVVALTGEARPLLLSQDTDRLSAASHLSYLEDPQGQWTLADVRAPERAGAWRSHGKPQVLSLGYTESRYWLRFRVTNGADERERWLMEVAWAFLDVVDVYVVHDGEAMAEFRSGDARPVDSRYQHHRHFVFPLSLPRGETSTVYLKVQTNLNLVLPVRLWAPDAFGVHNQQRYLVHGLLFGVMAVMVVYNLFIFLGTRSRPYLYYVLYTSAITLYLLALHGYASVYLWPGQQWLIQRAPVSLGIASFAFGVLFAQDFLGLKRNNRFFYQIAKVLIVFWVWATAMAFVVPHAALASFVNPMGGLTCVLGIIIGAWLWLKEEHVPARYFTIAWGSVLLGSLTHVMVLEGIVAINVLTHNALLVGAAIQVCLLSLALVAHVNEQKRQRQQARRRGLRAQRTALEAHRLSAGHLAKYRNLFENTLEGIFQWQPSGRIIGANPAFARLFGYPDASTMRAEVTDFARQCFASAEDFKNVQRWLEETDRLRDCEVLCLRRDGDTFRANLSARLVRDAQGRAARVDGFLVDITDRKQKEEAERRRAAAEDAERSKSAFLANMSHEIRTPINAVLGFTRLALDTELSEQQRSYLEKIRVSSNNLLGIINDILDFSKIEAGKLDLEYVDFKLSEIMDDVTGMLAHKASEKGIELVVSVAPNETGHLQGDPLRLSQVLINLANNSIKFTEQGEVAIRVSEKTRVQGEVELLFEVSDTGIGVSQEAKANLFSAYAQAEDSTSRHFGGTGLGLSISRQLVELMGGDIGVESVVGEGSTFWFTAKLPIASQTPALAVRAPPDLAGLEVLLVDEPDAGRRALAEIFESFGFAPSVADDGEAALGLVADTDYRLILVDRGLADPGTVATARRLREACRVPPPVVVMALSGEQELQRQAHAEGLRVLVKPVTPSAVLDQTLAALGRGQEEHQRHQRVVLSEEAMAGLQGARVLLVEDTPFNQEIAKRILEKAEVQVTVANNGREALQALSEATYDAVLMDLQMPEMDGFEATRAVRQDLDLTLPIIALTANAMQGDRQRCLDAGMDDYVSKPVAPKALFEALNRWLHSSGADSS